MPELIMKLLPVLIPIAIIELGLMVASLIHVLTHEQYRFGNRLMWVFLCVFVQIIGPILYFIIGRGNE